MITNKTQVKRLQFSIFAMLMPLLASAQTKVEINGIWYNLLSSTKQAEVTYKGSRCDEYWNEYSGSITIPATVTYGGKDYDVTSIGSTAFYDCSSLTDITLPTGVKNIENGAFSDCSSLTDISLPESITSIGSGAFYGCRNLTSITLPLGVTSLGSGAFNGCNNLASITIPESVTIIEEYVFYNCYSLTTINIPERVTLIGSYAFYGCSNLTTITISEGVTRIGNETFYNCSNLTSINIPKSITSIGDYAFYNCSNLTTINIPQESQLTSIGMYAFYKCYNLATINIPMNVIRIGKGAFGFCYNLIFIDIPESVTNIGGAAFQGCSSLTAVNIPKGAKLTSVEDYIFYGCNKLTSVNIPDGVTSIGNYSFQGCSTLASINIPEEVTSIGGQAFLNCAKLLDIYCYAEILPTVKSYAFDGTYPEKAILHVPANSLELYKTTAPWSSFGTIVAIENNLGKCMTPIISYTEGQVMLTCNTEEARIITTVTNGNDEVHEEKEFALTPTYTITAYATKENYEDSDIATLTLCWIPCTEEHESEEDGILTIPSKPVLIQSQDGTIVLSGLADDTEVVAYDLAGRELATDIASNGTAELATGLEVGNTAVVKIGNNSIKIVVK